MNPPLDAVRNRRVKAAEAFAEQFNHFEWEYLCSYQWFLTGVGQALETGNFAQLTARAEKTLINDSIRLRRAWIRTAPLRSAVPVKLMYRWIREVSRQWNRSLNSSPISNGNICVRISGS